MFKKNLKDSKGQKLHNGERERKDGRYEYRYQEPVSGTTRSVYASSLKELREKEKTIRRDLEDGINTSVGAQNVDVNTFFKDVYLPTRVLRDSTKKSYEDIWNNHVKDTIGKRKVITIKSSDIQKLYKSMNDKGLAYSTIKYLHTIINPMFKLAVKDNIIRQNPASGALKQDYGREAEERVPLTREEQTELFNFVKESNVYKWHHPMLAVMVATGLRVGELIGLTWDDIDFLEKKINVDHQLVYKDAGDGKKYDFHVHHPKTSTGVREIKISKEICDLLEEVKEMQAMLGILNKYEVDGLSGFVFVSKSGRPLQPSAINDVLKNIVEAYNKKTKEIQLPHISAHIMRHTACTRMAQDGVDIKVAQYIMGHKHISVTMDIYNHAQKDKIEMDMSVYHEKLII